MSHPPDIMAEHDPMISPQVPDVQPSWPRRRTLPESCDEEFLIEMATQAFVKELGLEDSTVLQGGKVELRDVAVGTHLMREDSHKDVALIYIICGTLTVSQRSAHSGPISDNEVHMFTAHQGEIVGGLAVLTGEPSFFTIKAKHFTRIALLSKCTFY
ncbi:UNVERIFIED_CONTAM: hypothetical protein B566_EDAN019535, partial [Ephemera danica]